METYSVFGESPLGGLNSKLGEVSGIQKRDL